MFEQRSPGCCACARTILEVDDVDDGVVQPLVPGLQAGVAGPVHWAGHQAEVGQQPDTGHPDNHYHRTSLQHCIYVLSTISRVWRDESRGHWAWLVHVSRVATDTSALGTCSETRHGEISAAHPHTSTLSSRRLHSYSTQTRRWEDTCHQWCGVKCLCLIVWPQNDTFCDEAKMDIYNIFIRVSWPHHKTEL